MVHASTHINIQSNIMSVTINSIAEPFCPGTWDGWLCWPDTPAGTYTFASCPDFIVGFDTSRKFLFFVVFIHNMLVVEVMSALYFLHFHDVNYIAHDLQPLIVLLC